MYGLAACVVLAITFAVTAVLTRPARPADAAPAAALDVDTARTAVPDEVSRDYQRSAPTWGPSVAASPSTVAKVPARPRPVAGLSQYQMDNAAVVVNTGRRMGLPAKAYLVAISTALQESELRNLANSTVPESLRYPHQGVAANYDSLGLFQQRASQNWGTVAQLMYPATASGLFYSRLVKVAGWQTMSVSAAAQAVQRSAFPDAYDRQQARAQQIVDAL